MGKAPAPSPQQVGAPGVATLFALAGSAALPACTAWKYAQFAQAPGWFDDDWALALVALFIAQLPLALLGTVFAGVSYLPGPTWRRVLIYAALVAVLGIVSGFAKFAFDSVIGPILAWAIALQLAILAFAGPQPELALRRIEATVNDSVNLFLLSIFGGLLAIIGAVVLEQYTRGTARHVTFEWSDTAWIGAAYFALRAWSGAYVHTAWFAARGKGYFERPWIEAVLRPRNRAGVDS